MRILNVSMVLVCCAATVNYLPSQAWGPLPTAKASISRIEVVASGTVQWPMKMRLKYLAAALRVGCQRGKIKRSKKMGPKQAGETSGEQGFPGGVLLPGWGPKQFITLGDDALKSIQIDVWVRCVSKGKMPLADLTCFITDLTGLVLMHEYVHTQQASGLFGLGYSAIECEAYRLECGLMAWYLAEVPKYNGVAPCSLGFEMRKQLKLCKNNERVVCGS